MSTIPGPITTQGLNESQAQRFIQNPILTPKQIMPSSPDMVIECLLNPGAFTFKGKIGLLLRVAERPVQLEGTITCPIFDEAGSLKILSFNHSDPDLDLSDARLIAHQGITYLSTISHLRLVWSDDGVNFYEPETPLILRGKGKLETFGIEDCRVAFIDGRYYLTYTQVSENGVGVGMMSTDDWVTMQSHGMIIPPHNKDCALFEEKINGLYYCLHRPSGVDLGGNFIWLASSPDLVNWGNHTCIARTRPGMWDGTRIGAGCSPIKTAEGWLEIYHGATSNHRYCLGALLLDLNDPSKVIARSQTPIMQPQELYETQGFFGEVIFTNGHIVNGDQLTVYYGAADEVICAAQFSTSQILASLK
jgi:predicted GH43/DUF377 family glycosyl hydrolase